MVPPDGDRAKRLPTLSWESVVDDGSSTTANPADPAPSSSATPETPAMPAPPVVPSPPPTAPLAQPTVPTASTASEPLTFEPMTLNVRTTPPAGVVPAIGDVEIGPADVSPSLLSEPLPEIREATPVDVTNSSEIEVLARVDAPPTRPQLPATVQPDQRAVAPVAALAYVDAVAPAAAAKPAGRKHRKPRRSRSGAKLLVTLVVLAGLVAAGIVFGRPYLFPDDWEGTAAPYADVVETGLGLEFVEPVAVVAEPAQEFDTRVATQLLGESIDVQPQWRALGLATTLVTTESVAQQVTGSQSAMYSLDDGQVYHDEGVAGPKLEAQLTEAMAAASLDQNFAWSPDQSTRTLDDAASTSAEVLRQARAAQQQSADDAPIAPRTTAQSAQLPAVLAYRALAPEHFAEFDNPVGDGADNPLHRLGEAGPGPFAADPPIGSVAPTMTGTDVATTSPQAMDRSFWFLALAGFLDSRTSFVASEAIVENSLTVAERETTSCVYATFSGGGVEQTDILRTALQAWSDAAPVEFASSFSVLSDGTLQLVTCDPGAEFQSPIRPAAAMELITWRMLELAVIEQVGSGDSDNPDFAFAWPIIQMSNVAIEVGSMPADTPPAERAAAVRDGVAAVSAPTD